LVSNLTEDKFDTNNNIDKLDVEKLCLDRDTSDVKPVINQNKKIQEINRIEPDSVQQAETTESKGLINKLKSLFK